MNVIKNQIIIKANVSVANWEDAIRHAGQSLLENDMIEERYIQAMIDIVNDKGPYIVLTRGLAMPHARPEDGARKVGISLITLKNPIEFGHALNDPVYVVAALSSVDNISHLTLMSSLAKSLGKKGIIDSISQAETCQEIYELLERGWKT
jgi:mannitol/fructose-specific phosphotransferase system IIA component (Ntr-type)